MHISTILWLGYIQAWCTMQPTKAERSYRDALSKDQKKEIQAYLGIMNYLGKFFSSTADTCKSLRKLTSTKTRVDLECNIPENVWQGKINHKTRCMHEFHDETKPLYIETEASGVGVEAALLQTRSNNSCPRDVAWDNSILRPIAFASKSLTGAEKKIQQYRKRNIRHTIWAGEIPPLLLCER